MEMLEVSVTFCFQLLVHIHHKGGEQPPVKVEIDEEKGLFMAWMQNIGRYGHVDSCDDTLLFRIAVFFSSHEGTLGSLYDKAEQRFFKTLLGYARLFAAHQIKVFNGSLKETRSRQVMQYFVPEFGIQTVFACLVGHDVVTSVRKNFGFRKKERNYLV